jgi:hypothetical protein
MCPCLHSGFGFNQTAITATLQEGLHAFLRTVRALLAVFVGKEDSAFQISADIPSTCFIIITRWFKYDRDKLWLVYKQIVPVIFEPPCITDFEVRKLNKDVSICTFVLYFLPSLLLVESDTTYFHLDLTSYQYFVTRIRVNTKQALPKSQPLGCKTRVTARAILSLVADSIHYECLVLFVKNGRNVKSISPV